MLSRVRAIAAGAGLAALAGLVSSCATERDSSRPSMPAAADSARLLRALHAELRGLASNPDFNIEFDSTRVEVLPGVRSRVVQGLTYHWAVLLYPDSIQSDVGGIRGLVATRDTLIQALRHAADWSDIAKGWEPNSREAAAWACAELSQVHYRRGPRFSAAVFGLDTIRHHFPVEMYSPEAIAYLARTLPDTLIVEDPKFPSSLRRVRLWLVHPGFGSLADEVVCELPSPMSSAGTSASIVIIRSLPRPRFPFDTIWPKRSR